MVKGCYLTLRIVRLFLLAPSYKARLHIKRPENVRSVKKNDVQIKHRFTEKKELNTPKENKGLFTNKFQVPNPLN